MAIKKTGGGSGKHAAGARRTGKTAEETPMALTLKVDNVTYTRLSALRATQRRSKQDIMLQALMEYLDRAGA
jgi:hypothetical protein